MPPKKQRRVFITGGTGSVGEALVKAFASSGYRVSFQFWENESKARRLERRFEAQSLQADFASAFVLPEHAFDVVINNAAINISDVEAHEVTRQDWSRTLQVNLTAAFEVVRQCLPFMLRQRWGRIINISSIYGLRGVEKRLPYTVTKHGLSGLTKTLAKEYARRGVTCNEICPGPIESDMMTRIATRASEQEGGTVADYLNDVSKEIPAGRMVRPAEVALLATFLASAEAGYITGASIAIDGGLIA